MPEFSNLGRLLMLAGAVVFVVGTVFWLGGRLPFLGRLPGDIWIQRKGFAFGFPIATCVVLSVLASLILHLISRR